MMRILLTRPKPESDALARQLAGSGFECRVEPMLDIVPLDPGPLPVEMAAVQAILVTSANGATRLPALTERRDVPVLAVGDATAAAVRALGFSSVSSANGAVDDLAALAIKTLDPAQGPLLHAAGETVAGDMAGTLQAAGFTLHRVTLYEARPAMEISPGTAAALKRGRLDAILFFSPRTAETFVTLAREAGLASAFSRLTAVAISEAAAAPCRALPWHSVIIAATPTQDGIVAALGTFNQHDQAKGGADATPPQADDTPQPQSTDKAMTDASDGKKTPPAAQPAKPGTASPKPGAASTAGSTSAASASSTAGTRPETKPDAKPEAPASARPAPAAPRKSRAKLYGYGLVAVILLGIIAFGTLPLWRPAVQPYLGQIGITLPNLAAAEDDSRIAPLADRIAALEQRAAQAATPPTDAPANDQAAQQIAALEARIVTLEERQTALSDEIRLVREMLAGEAGAAIGDTGPLNERLSALEAETRRLSEAAGQDNGQSAALDEMRGRQRALETALADLPRTDPAEIGRLREEIGVLRDGVARAAALDGRREALMLAVAHIATPVQQGTGYETEMAALTRLAGEEPAMTEPLSVLRDHAATGVPTLAVLRTHFPEAAAAAVRADRAGESQSVLGETLNRIAGLVSLRRTGQVEGETVEARTARAEEALDRNDLPAAITEMAALDGPAGEAIAGWLADARARLAVDTALTSLRSHAVAALSQPKAAAGGNTQ
ncbi:MAG: uroporphyrinogen-III synthase [Alphaproteobacteria bacterium]|nr:uroporphyrinogen-III synthase [Alphaproteobacteria bacterium]